MTQITYLSFWLEGPELHKEDPDEKNVKIMPGKNDDLDRQLVSLDDRDGAVRMLQIGVMELPEKMTKPKVEKWLEQDPEPVKRRVQVLKDEMRDDYWEKFHDIKNQEEV